MMTCDSLVASFPSPEWSAVLAARRQDAGRAVEALRALCAPYRQPLYAYLRMRGHSPDEAQDLAREFMGRLLQSKTLAYMKRDCGKLRSCVLTALKRFVNERETRVASGVQDESPERVFDDNWALALLNVVYDRLQAEYAAASGSHIFSALKLSLASMTDALPWNDLAKALGGDESAARFQVQSLRHRYVAILRDEISHLVATPADVDEELHYLFPNVAV